MKSLKNNRKKIIYTTTIAISLLSIFLVTIKVSYAAPTYTRNELQDYVVSTALSYLYNQNYTDYEGYWAEDSESVFSTQYTIGPEDISRSKRMNTQCEAFTATVYKHTFDYYFSDYYNDLYSTANRYNSYKNYNGTTVLGKSSEANTKILINYFSKVLSVTFMNSIAYNHQTDPMVVATYQQGKVSTFNSVTSYTKSITDLTTSQKNALIAEFNRLVQPGDIILNDGHAMLWVGDALEPTGGIIHSTGNSYKINDDGTTNSGYDAYSVRYSTAQYLYDYQIKMHGSKPNTVLTILRPINRICSFSQQTCNYSKTNSNAQARKKLNGLRVEQFLYNDTDGVTLSDDTSTVGKSDILSYRLYLTNKSKIEQCSSGINYKQEECEANGYNWISIVNNKDYSGIKITGTIPDNTEFVSCSNNCTHEGNKVTWNNVSLNSSETGTTKYYYYKVKTQKDNVTIVNDGMEIEYDNSTLKMGKIETKIVNSTTAEYRKKLKSLTDSDINNTNLSTYTTSARYITNLYTRYYDQNTNVTSTTFSDILKGSSIVSAAFKTSRYSNDKYYEIKSASERNATTGTAKVINTMIVPHFYGGKKYEQLYHSGSMDYYSRVKPIWASRIQFNYGDIILTLKQGSSSFTIDKAMIYLGLDNDTPVYLYYDSNNKKLVRHRIISNYNGTTTSYYSNKYLLDILHGSDLYVVLRPTQYYKPVILSNVIFDSVGSEGNEWTSNTCTAPAIFDSENKTCKKEVDYRTTYGELPTPVRNGYSFVEWVYEGNSGEEIAISPSTELNTVTDITLSAKWRGNPYTITFDSNGGSSVNSIEAAYGENIAAPTDPEREGYTFKGWYKDSELTEEFVFDTMPNGNMTLYAKWDKTMYTVNFNSNGGSLVSSQNVEYGNKVTEPTYPIRNGYSFNGWYSDSTLQELYDFDTSVTSALTLHAKWLRESYQITYYLDGGSATNPNSYNVESDTFTLNNPTKVGYTFIGWTGSNGNVPEKTVTIEQGSTGIRSYIANYEINKFTVNFNSNGGSTVESQEVNYGNKATEPVTPEKEGYAFENWYSDADLENAYDFNTSVTSNITLHAKWISGKYQITYDLDGGSVNNPTYYDVETTTFTLNNPTKEGYTFTGWTGSNGNVPETTVTIPQGSTGVKNYVANWSINSYTISFDVQGMESISYNYGQSITLPTPNKTGYTFLGWYTDQSLTDRFDDETMPSNDVNLYPAWLINTHTVTFNTNGGSNINTLNVEYGHNIPIPSDPLKEGYKFMGWYSDSDLQNSYTFTTMPDNDLVLYAKWEINTYDVTFNTNGGSAIQKVEVEYNNSVSKPNDPTKEGYTFKNWYSDRNLTSLYDFSSLITSDITLYAKWEKDTYSITYNLNGGEINNPVSYDMDTDTFTLKNPIKEGYTFTGWTGSNGNVPSTTVTIEQGTVGDKTYTANWSINSYTISFETNGGSSVSPITKNYGELVEAPSEPQRDKYRFAGWYADSELNHLYSFTTMPSENITLYAKWAKTEFIISYVLEGGINNEGNPTIYSKGNTLELMDATKEGYIFKGWYKEANYVTRVESITEDMEEDLTLYAKWEGVKYNLYFETNGGKEIATEQVPNGDDLELPTPTRVGYTFKGWYKDEELTQIFSSSVMPAEDLALYAKWAVNQYTISFNSNGGSKVTAIKDDYGTTITEPTKPLKEGYKFAGWYSDKALTKVYSFTTIPANNITLYAKWVNNNTNVISYDTNGGTNSTSNPTTYKSGTEIKLETPTKEGYKFGGWYLESDYKTRVYTISSDMSGDIKLYAKWIGAGEQSIKVPDTASKRSVATMVIGIMLILIAGYFIYTRSDFESLSRNR